MVSEVSLKALRVTWLLCLLVYGKAIHDGGSMWLAKLLIWWLPGNEEREEVARIPISPSVLCLQ
jgi:hypothetical protein